MPNEPEPVNEAVSAQPTGSADMGPVGCQPSLEEIYKYMDGYLDEDRQSVVSSHLHNCGGCDDLYHFQAGLKNLLGTRCQSELPADLPQRVFRAITDLS
ncbi:MAG: anti-sigma factor family protein [Acidimicrobiales bacterium]